jgi:hypothetical protein
MVSPVNGNGPAIPPDPPPPTNLTEEQFDTLNAINFDLRAGIPDDPSRITINAFLASTVEPLLDLIEALKSADLQGDRDFLLGILSRTTSLVDRLSARNRLSETQRNELVELSNTANDLNEQKQVIDASRDNYNDAVDDYLAAKESGIGVAEAEDALIAARDAHNQAVLDYNELVEAYHDIIAGINETREAIGVPLLSQTNSLPIVRPFSEGVLIDFDPASSPPAPNLVPPIDLEPPPAFFEEFRLIGAGEAYAATFDTFIGIRDDLNDLIDQINDAGDPISLQHRNEYNALVVEYNNALAAMEAERIAFNEVAPLSDQLDDPGIEEEGAIDGTTTTPLDAIVANPPEPNLDSFSISQLAEGYNAAVDDLQLIADQFNILIASINANGSPIDQDLVDQYNALATEFNQALSAVESERERFNLIVPPFNVIPELMIDEIATIDENAGLPLETVAVDAPDPARVETTSLEDLDTTIDVFRYEETIIDHIAVREDLNALIDLINDSDASTVGETFAIQYNNLVDFFNASVRELQSQRAVLNNYIVNDADKIPEINIDPLEKISDSTTTPLSSINTANPPMPSFRLLEARNDIREIVQELDDVINSINGSDLPLDQSLVNQYNSLANQYNNALSDYKGEINNYNNIVEDFFKLPQTDIADLESIGTEPDLPLAFPAIPASEILLPIGRRYQDAANDFIAIREELNDLIFDIISDDLIDEDRVEQYNALVEQYNTALAVLINEINLLNSVVPEGSEIQDPGIETLEEININTAPSSLEEIVADPPEIDPISFFSDAADIYNEAVSDFLEARDVFNAVLEEINDAFNDPAFNFETDYEALKDLHNNALIDYNAALNNLLEERDVWNNFVDKHARGANNVLFDHHGDKAPLPDDPADIPPPRSNVSVLSINRDLNQFEDVRTGRSRELTNFVRNLLSSPTDILALLELASQDRNLLSLIFLARGKATSELYQPIATAASAAGGSPSAQGGGLASLVLGLASPRIQSALSSIELTEAIEGLFESADASPPAGLPGLVQSITTNGGVGAALSSTRFALKLVADFLEVLSPESFPVNLAAALGMSQALASISNNGGFSEITRSALSGVGSIDGLPNDNQEALFDSIGNLSAFTLVFAAAADLGNVVNKAPQLALGTLALNLSFGISGTQLDLREAIKSIKNVLGDEQLPGLQQTLAEAFADILAAGGIEGDASEELAVRLASDLFAAEDPESILREIAPEALQGPLANLVALASFSPDQALFEDLLLLAEREGGLEAIENRFRRRGIDEDLASDFIDIAGQEQSALRSVAQLEARLGPEAVQAGFTALRDLEIASSLNQKLKGELGQSDAQSLIREALTSINSLDNIQERIIREFVEEEQIEAVRTAADAAKELFREREEPSLYLSRLQQPTRAMIHAASSIMAEGTLPPSTAPGLRTFPSSASREIDFRV